MDYQIRTASASHVDLIVNHRRRMFVDAGEPDDERMAEISRAFRDWLSGRLADGRYLEWLCMADDQVVGGFGMVVLDWPPGPLHVAPGRGYLLNMYVDPEHRRKGLARRLMRQALEEAKRRGLKLVALHATVAGRPLYESLGFAASNEMHWRDRQGSTVR
jgi:GNAT superfamily N-acetyltransferase